MAINQGATADVFSAENSITTGSQSIIVRAFNLFCVTVSTIAAVAVGTFAALSLVTAVYFIRDGMALPAILAGVGTLIGTVVALELFRRDV